MADVLTVLKELRSRHYLDRLILSRTAILDEANVTCPFNYDWLMLEGNSSSCGGFKNPEVLKIPFIIFRNNGGGIENRYSIRFSCEEDMALFHLIV